MDIDVTVMGQVISVFVVVIGLLSYYLGRRKTQTPILAGLLGAVLAIVPVIGAVYLVVLVLKNDINSSA